ncbi:MAG: glycosyltransferase family 4 protein [Magnetococcales bacterium]|nr:glycosyltransferase family 4 protein [Magnetococcales bacterium]
MFEKRPLKVCHICPQFKLHHGGGEPVLFNLFREMADVGFENTVLTNKFPDEFLPHLDKRVQLKGLPRILNFRFKNPLLESLLDFILSPFLLTNIPKNTDVICFYTENMVPAMFFYKILFRGKCLYYCFQPPRFAYDVQKETVLAGGKSVFRHLVPIFSWLYRPFDRIVVGWADHIVVFSKDYKKWVEQLYRAKKVSVLPPGVARPKKLLELPEKIQNRLADDSQIIIFSGKFVGKKNLDRVLNVLNIVVQSNVRVLLLLVGDGPEKGKLEQITREYQLEDHVVFCGFVSDPEAIFSFYNIAELGILLEKNVSFGLSLTEANACGVPVLAFDKGGPSDIVKHGQNGFLLPLDASDEDIAELILNYFSGPVSSIMQKASIDIAQRYSWPRFGRHYANLLHSLTDGT